MNASHVASQSSKARVIQTFMQEIHDCVSDVSHSTGQSMHTCVSGDSIRDTLKHNTLILTENRLELFHLFEMSMKWFIVRNISSQLSRKLAGINDDELYLSSSVHVLV